VLGGEASRVNGEVCLNRTQRCGRLLDKSLKQRRQFGLFKVVEDAIIGRGFDHKPLSLQGLKVYHCPSTGDGGIDLTASTYDNIRQQMIAPSSPYLLWLFYAPAQSTQKFGKPFLFMGLSLVVGRPLLRAGHFNRLGVYRAAVWPCLSLDYELNSVYVLAGQPPLLEVGAGAERRPVVEVDDITAIARLGRHFPAQLVLFYLTCVGYYHPSFYSCVHLGLPYLSLFYAYYTIQCIALSRGKPPICKNSLVYSLLTSPYRVWYNPNMGNEQPNEVQTRLAQLQEKGWTLAALADELEITTNAVEKWKAGDRTPSNLKATLAFLDKLLERKRIPKRRRYAAKGDKGDNE
jgi:hypothetical protein